MSQQNLNKIYSQVRPVETLVSSSADLTTIPAVLGDAEVYLLTKYDSGKTFYLENDSTVASGDGSFALILPEETSEDMLGWNAKFITKTFGAGPANNWPATAGACSVGAPPVGGTVVLTGSITAGTTGFSDLILAASDIIGITDNNKTLEIICTEASSTATKFVFTTKG